MTVFSTLALVAFAANSLLCRAALGSRSIDAASFTGVRLFAGALTLWLVARTKPRPAARSGSWPSAMALFAYAAAFSFAYSRVGAGVGALILFSSVQLTMLAAALRAGERPHALEWTGWILAAAGLCVLTAPASLLSSTSGATGSANATVPIASGLASSLMMAAGCAWAVYTLRGRGTKNPLVATADNFSRSLLPAAALSLVTLPYAHVTMKGILLAATSGALASGIGYSLWYAALPSLSATRAATIQLAVPVIAAIAAVGLLGEPLTARLLIATFTIVVGVGLSLRARAAVM